MLKHLMIPFAASAAVLAGAAYAESTSGAIQEVNDEQDMVMLENGDSFYFDANTNLAGFSEGNVVTINWALNGDRMEAETIVAVEGSNVINGQVTAADMTAHALVIDGKTYLFDPTVDLSGIKVGDSVRVTYLDQPEPKGLAVFIPAS
jgi:hypothetical protein